MRVELTQAWLDAQLRDNPDFAEACASVGIVPSGEKAPKPSKYRNTPTEFEGVIWASTHEAERAFLLINQQANRDIFCLCYHVPFEVQPEGAQKIVYVADFVYLEAIDGVLRIIVEDAKAWDKETQKFRHTRQFTIKRKLFEARYRIKIREV